MMPICPNCEKEFIKNTGKQLFCCRKCRDAYQHRARRILASCHEKEYEKLYQDFFVNRIPIARRTNRKIFLVPQNNKYSRTLEIPLRNGGKAIVDNTIKNSELLGYSWWVDGHGYPITVIDGSFVHLHHMIFGFPKEPNTVVDHINRNVLDSRISNLRLVTKSENNFNKGTRIDNAYGKTGVYYDKNRSNKPWYARISKKSVVYNLGNFNTFAEAVEARERAEIDLYGYVTEPNNEITHTNGIHSSSVRAMSASANRSKNEKSRKRGSGRDKARWGK